jgi:SSS family solute:Na+ symporter
VPEYLRLRFNEATHAFNAATFAVATVLISGVNLFALALIIHLMLGWSIATAILVAAALVLVYITLGGLTSAIYNEVLQFFVIVAALLPLTLVALHSIGGIHGIQEKVKAFKPLGEPGLHAWQGLGIHHVTNPLASDWVGVVFGLGFVLSFGYWTTNFAEVQRALSARNMSAARRTPLIGAYPKIFLPAIIILPGLIAVLTVHGLGVGKDVSVQYNTAIPHLIGNFLPEGMLGIAVTGLLAAFMAGVAANVTAFNTVVTYDIVQSYFAKDRDAAFYLRTGRIITVAGILISVLTAFIAKGYSNIMNYIQTLFSIFNAPLFATFIIAMFWRRATAWGGFFSLVAGTGLHRQPPERVPHDLPFRLGAERELLAGDHRVHRRCDRARRRVPGHAPETGRGPPWPRLGPHPQGGARSQRRPARQAVVALPGAARWRGYRHPRRPQHHLRLIAHEHS